jgi:hypothetical protein
VTTLETLLSFNNGVQARDFTGFYKDTAKLGQEQTSPKNCRRSSRTSSTRNSTSRHQETGAGLQETRRDQLDSVLVIDDYYPTTPKRVVFRLQLSARRRRLEARRDQARHDRLADRIRHFCG